MLGLSSDARTRPAVLILGGITTLARPLALYLLSSQPAACVKIADRFSVSPPSTHLDRPFLELLSDPRLSYQQINLAIVTRHTELFTLPRMANPGECTGEAQGFDVIFDLTGEIGFDKPELIQISNTYSLALSLATSASSLPLSVRPKAYVRLTYSFYEMKSLPSSSAGHPESADLRPDGARGRWWHETLRGLGALREKEGLNVGVIRAGAWYGPGTWGGEIIPRVVAGQVYQYLKEEMKVLYNSDLRINTIHTSDLAQSLHLLSQHLIAHPPRSPGIISSLVKVPFSFPGTPTSTFSITKDRRSSDSDTWKTVSTVIPTVQEVELPLFNIVDDADSTQGDLAKAVAEVWRIKYGFLNSAVASLMQQFAKTDFAEMVEDVNEMHVEAWCKMLAASKPPISSTPISPFLDEHAFRKMAICLDGSRARSILGFAPAHPGVEVTELISIVKGFQQEGIWPIL